MKTAEEKANKYVEEEILKLYSDSELMQDFVQKQIKYAKIDFLAGYKEGQSSPKIKQLEWVKIDEDGVKGIQAKTPFGDYDMYERVGHDGSILWGFDQEPYVFDTEIEAKMYAQADFEKRVIECLDL